MIKEFKGEHAFLSNFHPSPIEFEGEIYPTVEHAFQAAKTDNPEHRKIIREKEKPGQAKRAGSKRGKLIELREDWDNKRFDVMVELIRKKFEIPAFRMALLATGDEELQEGNRWNDTCWGVSLKTGKGNNYLGLILMDERDRIRDEG